jgi:hypothetical protein
VDFEPFPKIARLSRECVITEKIDGTNAQILIERFDGPATFPPVARADDHYIGAGSRTRYITPGKATDNYGFAAWVAENAGELVKLGPGRHFGEWWGLGIQRGYGLTEKRFSLFNVGRWADRHMGGPFGLTYTGDGSVGAEPATGQQWAPKCCHVVPVLYRGEFSTLAAESWIVQLRYDGSVAAPGFMNPEGLIVFHSASGTLFKKTLDKDEQPKGRAA